MIVWEIDWREVYTAFAPLEGEAHAHLLHGGDHSTTAEWSIIVAFPNDVLNTDQSTSDNLFMVIQERLNARKVDPSAASDAIPFASGLVGYAGYEAARLIEPTLDLPRSPFALPDASFGLYNAAALFSRRTRRAYITGCDEAACKRLKGALGVDLPTSVALPGFGEVASNFSVNDYETSIRAVIEDIRNGDYYQANIAHQMTALADQEISPLGFFRRIAEKSDASFCALLQLPEGAVVSNAPERFFRMDHGAQGRRIVAEPIKGTRPRGATVDQDQQYAEELLADPKDRAENIMIADLMRNDLSKICRDGSIQEEAICELMSLSSVHHLVSRISGELRADISIADIFTALFPCGSVTGAPKIEAMKAIARTEQIGRGPYCGAIGYIDDRGGADFSVAIRTMMLTEQNRKVTIPVGGGVTLRSDPHQEYEETLAKARAALDVIGNSTLQRP